MTWCKGFGHDFRKKVDEKYIGGITISKKRRDNPPQIVQFGGETEYVYVASNHCRHCGLSKKEVLK